MILDFLLFPIFLGVIYAVGAGVLRIAGGGNFKHDDYPSWFYFTVAIFTIGFTAVLFNFFAGVASPLFYVIIAGLFIVGAVQLRCCDSKDFYEVIILGLILAPFAANMPPGPDAGLYHLPHQLWIRDEKIVFGLANFNTRFGFSSFSEYVLAPLWIHEQFKLLSYMAATYFLILLLFLTRMVRSSSAATAALGAITLVTLIFNSKYFVIGYTSTDTPCGVFFAIAFFCGFRLLSKDSAIQKKHLVLFFFSALLTFFYKANGVIMFLWVLFVIIHLLRTRRITWGTLTPASILPALLALIWLVRGVIISGCLLYPMVSTCLNVPWVAAKAAVVNADAVTVWARQQDAAPQLLPDWFAVWWWPHNWQFCLYQLATVVFGAGLYRYFCKERLGACRDIALSALLFTLLVLSLWFIKSPTPRFGIGVFTILPAMIAINVFDIRRLPHFTFSRLDQFCRLMEAKTVVSTLAGILVVVLAVKLVIVDAVGGRNRTYLHFTMLTVATTPTQPYGSFGVKPNPIELAGCWAVKYCSPDYTTNDTIREKYGYKYFHE